ncbi:hypothetical protein D3C85_1170810 [compost metagenome]
MGFTQHRNQLPMATATQFARGIATVFFNDDAVGLGGDFSLDTLAHQEAGDKPFEQAAFVCIFQMNTEIAGTDRFVHFRRSSPQSETHHWLLNFEKSSPCKFVFFATHARLYDDRRATCMTIAPINHIERSGRDLRRAANRNWAYLILCFRPGRRDV